MKKIIIRQEPHRYPEDIRSIIKAFNEAGYDLDESQAVFLWSKYSDSMCAGWMSIPDTNKEIIESVNAYFDEENNKTI